MEMYLHRYVKHFDDDYNLKLSYTVCIDVTLIKQDGSERSIKWSLGHCTSHGTYRSERLYKIFAREKYSYTQRCCLKENHYTLTCEITSLQKIHEGWAEDYLDIQGRQYCNDFFGFRAMRQIWIAGMF